MEDISSFIKLHNTQLRHLGVPRELWKVLEKKLSSGTTASHLDEEFSASSSGVTCFRDIPAHGDIWPVQHLLRTRKASDIFTALQRDPALMLKLADSMQLLDGSSSEDEEEPEGLTDDTGAEDGQQEDGGIYGTLFKSMKKELLKHVFMFEACGMRARYIHEPMATRMGVSADPHVEIAPFLWLAADGDHACGDGAAFDMVEDACTQDAVAGVGAADAADVVGSGGDGGGACSARRVRVRVRQVLSIAWPVRDIKAGEGPLTRAKLPLGLADYSTQDFWAEAYRCEKGTEEWYCGMTDGLSALLAKYCAPISDSMDGMGAGEEVVSSSGLRPRVLMAGCGNSTLGVEVWKAGYDVVNADYVQEVVDLMEHAHPASAHPGMTWVAADLTTMHNSPLAGTTFDAIVDKATLDALLTADAADATRWRTGSGAAKLGHVAPYLSTLSGLLRPGKGVLALVSLRPPASMQALLEEVNTAREAVGEQDQGITSEVNNYESSTGNAGQVWSSPHSTAHEGQQQPELHKPTQEAFAAPCLEGLGLLPHIPTAGSPQPPTSLCEGPSSCDDTSSQPSSMCSLSDSSAHLSSVCSELSLASCLPDSAAPPRCGEVLLEGGLNSPTAAAEEAVTPLALTACGAGGVRDNEQLAGTPAPKGWQIVEHVAIPEASAHTYVCRFAR